MKILKIEDRIAVLLLQDYLRSVNETKNINNFEDLLISKDVESLNFGEYDPTKRLLKIYLISGRLTAKNISDVAGNFKFDDPKALEWIKKYSAEDVVGITKESKNAIREILYKGFSEGIPPKQQALLIKNVIGLDTRRVRAVLNYVDGLLEAGFSAEDVEKRAAKYSEKLLRKRAEVIAINETLVASAEGHYKAVYNAYDSGILDKTYVEYRIVTPDERLCPICRQYEGEIREIPNGSYASTGNHTPKMHIRCRCVAGIKKR